MENHLYTTLDITVIKIGPDRMARPKKYEKPAGLRIKPMNHPKPVPFY